MGIFDYYCSACKRALYGVQVNIDMTCSGCGNINNFKRRKVKHKDKFKATDGRISSSGKRFN